MIVTLDGPAGAGKSSVARALAMRLGFRFLDTGAMYRAVALAGMLRRVDWDRPERLAEIARAVRIELSGDRVLLDGADVSEAIRTPEVTRQTRFAADNPEVRAILVEQQRAIAGEDDIVTEGRDQGSVVFPRAECKIYLTASPEERARRRHRELCLKGADVSYETLLKEQNDRDLGDASRAVGPLVQAGDALCEATDGLTQEQVIDRLEAIVRARQEALAIGRR